MPNKFLAVIIKKKGCVVFDDNLIYWYRINKQTKNYAISFQELIRQNIFFISFYFRT